MFPLPFSYPFPFLFLLHFLFLLFPFRCASYFPSSFPLVLSPFPLSLPPFSSSFLSPLILSFSSFSLFPSHFLFPFTFQFPVSRFSFSFPSSYLFYIPIPSPLSFPPPFHFIYSLSSFISRSFPHSSFLPFFLSLPLSLFSLSFLCFCSVPITFSFLCPLSHLFSRSFPSLFLNLPLSLFLFPSHSLPPFSPALSTFPFCTPFPFSFPNKFPLSLSHSLTLPLAQYLSPFPSIIS